MKRTVRPGVIRLIGLDVDGTLLDSQGLMSAANCDAAALIFDRDAERQCMSLFLSSRHTEALRHRDLNC